MKSLYFALAFVCCATVSLAQKSFILHYQPKLGFVSVSGGSSLPMGAFGSQAACDKQAGLAKPGTVMNLAAGYRLIGAFGLMGRFQQQSNNMNSSSVLDSPYITEANARVATVGKWTMTTALFGPYISLPMGRFALDLRALAGPAMAVCPANGVEGWLADVPLAVRTSQGQASSRAYSGGLTLSYRLGRSLAAQVSADYTTASFNFTGMTLTTQDGTRIQTSLISGQKTISTLNVQGGLTFLFGNRYRPF